MMRCLAAFLIFLFSFHAQAYQLSGTVTGTDGEPVAYASVFEQNTTYGVATDLAGAYFIELSAGSHVLVVQAVGYVTKEVAVNITANTLLNIELQVAALELQEVEVNANRKWTY